MGKFEVKLPKMGESVAEATITTWLKEVGDSVDLDEAIVEIATDKVDSEVPSEVEGTLVEILFNSDDVVKVGDTIAIIETVGEEGNSDDAASSKIAQIDEPDEVATLEKEVTDVIESTAISKVSESGSF